MTDAALATIPITGRQLTLPPGPLFHLHKAADARYEIGAFRPWAGYKDFGSDAATAGLALFQHVLSFGPTEQGGRTGVHCHLAHAHIVIPTSGRALFSYDGIVTEAVSGSVIVQHGGTVHDQFHYSYAPASVEENGRTRSRSIRPRPVRLSVPSASWSCSSRRSWPMSRSCRPRPSPTPTSAPPGASLPCRGRPASPSSGRMTSTPPTAGVYGLPLLRRGTGAPGARPAAWWRPGSCVPSLRARRPRWPRPWPWRSPARPAAWNCCSWSAARQGPARRWGENPAGGGRLPDL
ncbi:MAG: hypothetical protein WDN45_00310 [Caulobacteraceae bacterium]